MQPAYQLAVVEVATDDKGLVAHLLSYLLQKRGEALMVRLLAPEYID
jgi:hypothetical protein